jgi:hypothetical protein
MVDTPRKTFPELQALTAPVVDSDVLAVYRTPGPAKRTTASVLGTYVNTVIGTPFTRTLLDDADAVTARATLAAVGTAELAATGGSALVGFIQSGTGASARTAQAKGRDIVDVRDFGAVGDGATDDTAAINAALLAHRVVRITGGGTYNVTTINMTQARACLIIDGGTTLAPQNAAINAVAVSGAGATILGPGRILSPASWNGTNSQRTYGTVWVTGNDFFIYGVKLENIPRAGVHFEGTNGGRIEACWLNGNYPYASYNEATTTGQIAIDYDTGTEAAPTVIVVGNRIDTCIQGVLQANYGAATTNAGITIVGNAFNQCWDHGVYTGNAESTVITGNNFFNCRRPVAAGGTGFTLTGNTMYATETSQSNGQQDISIRDAVDAVVSGNTIIGVGAGMDIAGSAGVTIARVIVSNNVIKRVGVGQLGPIIRVGDLTQVCDDVVIENNTLYADNVGANLGAITFGTVSASYKGNRSIVRNNKIVLTGVMLGETAFLQAVDHNDLCVEKNDFVSDNTAASSLAFRAIFFGGCANHSITGNRFFYTSGGTNVIFRGVQNNTAGTITDNYFNTTAPSSVDILGFVTAGADVRRNKLASGALFISTATIASGTSSIAVSNSNARAAWSSVSLQPTTNAAGTLVATPGVKAVITDNTITVSTADGSNAPSDCAYRYVLE